MEMTTEQTKEHGAEDWKKILRVLVTLSIPTVAEEVLATLLQYVDTAMVGQLGEQATAAVSVTTTINWLIGSLAGALGVAVLAMISKAYGAGDEERIRDISGQVVLAVLVSGAILTVLALAVSPYIPVWMGAEENVRRDASAYFFIISLPLLFRTGSTLFASAIRAIQNTMLPMLISLSGNLLNAGLNYIFIYSLGLGVRGAAIASAISYTFSGTFMYLAYRKNKYLRWKWSSLRINTDILRQGAALSLPVLGTSFVSCMGYIFFAGLVSGMGTTVFAAHSIAVTAETIFYIPGYGLRTATSALVGASLGERNKKKFELVAVLSVGLTVGMMVLSGMLLYVIAGPLMSIFSSSGRVVTLGAQMLRLVAFSEPFFGLMVVLEGIFYGLGKTRYAFVVESVSMWGIRIFFTFLCVKVWNLDLRAVWYCMIADNIFKALLLAALVLTKKRRESLFPEECVR